MRYYYIIDKILFIIFWQTKQDVVNSGGQESLSKPWNYLFQKVAGNLKCYNVTQRSFINC